MCTLCVAAGGVVSVCVHIAVASAISSNAPLYFRSYINYYVVILCVASRAVIHTPLKGISSLVLADFLAATLYY